MATVYLHYHQVVPWIAGPKLHLNCLVLHLEGNGGGSESLHAQINSHTQDRMDRDYH